MFQKPSKTNEFKGAYRLPVEKLYPGLTREQLAEAEYFLLQYLEVIRRILEQDPDEK